MIRNYFTIAWRNLTKNKVYSLINILGLALGMAVSIIIGLWVYDEYSYNHHFRDRERIAQVFQTQTFNARAGTGTAIPRPLEPAMREGYARHFDHIVMSSWNYPNYLKYGDKVLSRTGNAMQEGAVDLLELEVIKGAPNGIKDPSSMMLSESTAKALFGEEDPIGKIVKVNSQFDMMVSSVYRDIPKNNSFSDLEFLMPWDQYVNSQEWVKNAINFWGNNSFQMFVKLKEGSDLAEVNGLIRDIKKNAARDEAQFNPQLLLLPMTDWYLRSEFENGKQSGGRIENLWLVGSIGFIVLLLACINFMNLSTARSEKRSREVGIRKTLGSDRSQLIRQFLSESLFTVVLSFGLAVLIVLLSLKGFNELSSKEISFPWADFRFWLSSAVFIVLTAVLAGSYPALYLSSFEPVQVLKGTFKAGRNAALPRKILVVTQFTMSVALIIGTMVIVKQIYHSQNRPVGYDRAGLIQIPVMSQDFNGKYDLLRQEFLNSGAVVSMASSSSPATAVWSNRSGWSWEGKPEGFQEDFAWVEVSPEYPATMKLEFVEGRDFSREFASDSNAVILNETAVRYMGIKDPIGKLIRDSDVDTVNIEPPLKIIGVVKDMIMQSPYEPVKQTLFLFDRWGDASFYNLRLNPDKSVAEGLDLVEQVFLKHFPDLPFQYQFIDEQFAQKFANEKRIAKLTGLFTVLAIIISCLGLFGLVSFVAEQRTKEIGVRKVLGASVGNLWLMLSRDFLILVAVALCIAIPLAYLIMGEWIQKFQYRTELSWWIFVMAGCGAILISGLTISFQAVKAAGSNPVRSLRTE